MSDDNKPLEDQERVFLLARGDAMLELVKQLRENKAKELAMMDTILKLVGSYDQNLAIPDNGRHRLLNMMRTLKPKETAGLSDEEILKMVGGLNGKPAAGG